MVIDTSAVLAILLSEPEWQYFEHIIDKAPARLISTASVLEAAVVVQQKLGDKAGDLDALLTRFPLEIVPVDLPQLHWARYAFATYGRGRHPARLNFGDCFSYALAKVSAQPLLFKGDDFSQTDLDLVS